MDIKVLGPLEAREQMRSVVPRAGKQRQLFALLSLRAGTVLPVGTLIEELWAERPPRTVTTTLQTYVLGLRRLIGPTPAPAGARGPKEILAYRFGGYLLDIGSGTVDANAFEELAVIGERAFDVGDHEAAGRLLGSALEMWRGPALVDVAHGTVLEMEVTRLTERRLGVLETRIEANLRTGRHHPLLSELSLLRAQYPLNEQFCASQMLALYRAGRPWQALDSFLLLRGALVDELGIEPSSRLQVLYQRVLDSDPALDWSATETPFRRSA